MSPPRDTPLHTRVRERILAGRLAAGAPIRQDKLAAELGVSKIPLRETLTRLESEGLVASHANQGFRVRPLTRAEVEDIFELRLQIEPPACARGALCAGAADKQIAARAHAALQLALARGAKLAGPRNREFHLSLVRPSGRAVTLDAVRRLLALSERYVRVHLGPSGRTGRASDEHAALLQAWLDGQADLVRKLAEGHIKTTLRDLLEQLPQD